MIKPQVKIEMVVMEDPTFGAGETRIARIVLTNLAAQQFTYLFELYLDVTKAATSGVWQVVIEPNASVTVGVYVVMPLAAGTYEVFVDVWHETTLLAHYQATEDITIAITPAVLVESITWS